MKNSPDDIIQMLLPKYILAMIPNFRISAIVGLMLVAQLVSAQRTELKRAENLYENRDFYQALEYYNAAVEKGDNSIDTKVKIARCYFNLNDIQTALNLYTELESSLKDKDDLSNYASCYLQEYGAYELAIEWYQKAKQAGANPMDMDARIEACKWANENPIFNPDFRVNPADLLIGGQSFGIQFYNDEVVYSAEKAGGSKKLDNTGKGFLNLYSSKYIDGEIQEGSSSFSSNLEYDFHVGATSFTSDFKRIYYTKVVKIKGGDRIKIFTSEYNGKDWVNEKELSANSDDYDIGYPAVSPDDKYLFFTSSQRGGFGGQDIYKAKIKNNGDVERPESVGNDVNTYGNEKWPYISKEGDLYFASDGHLGFGGLDIFKAELINGKYTNVTNMGQPINSGKDDFGFVLDPNDSRKGFLSSNRIGTGSTDGIFMMLPTNEMEDDGEESIPVFDEMAVEPEPVEETTVIVAPPVSDLSMYPAAFSTTLTSTFKGTPIDGAQVVIKDANTGDIVATGTSDANGKVMIPIPDEFKSDSQEFEIELSKGEDYNAKRMIVHIMEIEDINNNGLSLTPIFEEASLNEIGKFVIPYEGDEVTEEGKVILDKLAAFLLQNPNVVVKLNGHTEAKGNKYKNLDISQSASESAEKYLMMKGVNDENMIPRGYGERYLLNKCKRGVYCEQSEHIKNRRIEVVVWKRLN